MPTANEGRSCDGQLTASPAKWAICETPCEGWTPCLARVPTSYGEQWDDRANGIELCKLTNATVKGCTQSGWGAILIESSRWSSKYSRNNSERIIHEQCTKWKKYEGHTRYQRGVASYEAGATRTVHEGYTCRWQGVTSCGTRKYESCKPSGLVTKGCTQLHWGATLVGGKSRGSVKGCTQLH